MKWGKVLRWIGLIVVAVLVMALFSVNYLLTQNRQQLAGLLSDLLGRNVVIEGDISFHPFPYPALTAESVRIENPSWASRPNTIFAQSLSVSVALSPLLKQTIDIRDMTLQGANLLLEQNTDGQVNWMLPAIFGGPDTPATPDENGDSSAWQFAGFRNIKLEQAIIGFKPAGAPAYSVELENTQATVFANQRLQLVGHGSYRSQPVLLEASGGTYDELLDDAGPAFPLDGKIKLGKNELTVMAMFARPLGGPVTLQSHVAGQNLSDALNLANVDIPASGPYALSATLVIGPEGYQADDIHGQVEQFGQINKIEIREGKIDLPQSRPVIATLNGKIESLPVSAVLRGGTFNQLLATDSKWPLKLEGVAGEISLKSQGKLDLSSEEILADLDLAVEGKSLVGFESWVPGALMPLAPFELQGHLRATPDQINVSEFSLHSGKSRLGGALTLSLAKPAPRLLADLNARLIDIGPLIKPAPPAGSVKHRQKPATDALSQRLAFSLPKGFDADVKLAVSELRGLDFPLRYIKGKVKLDQATLRLAPLRFSLPGVKARLDARLRTTGRGLEVEAKTSSQRIALNSMLSGLGIKAPVSGLVQDVKAELSGSGKTLAGLIQDSNISLSVGESVVFLHKAEKGKRLKVNLQRSVANSHPGKSVGVSLEGKLGDAPFSVTAKGGSLPALLAWKGKMPFTLNALLAGSSLTSQGSFILPLLKSRSEFSYQLSGKNLYDLEPLLNTKIPVHGDYEVAGTVILGDKILSLPTFTAVIEQSRIKGGLTIKEAPGETIVDGHVNISQLSLDMLGGKKKKAETGLAAEEEKILNEVIIPVNILQKMNLSFDLVVEKIIRHQHGVGDLALQASIKQGVVSIKPFELNLGKNGTVAGSVEFDSSETPPSMNVNISSNKVDYGGLLQKMDISDVAEGSFELNLKLQGRGNTLLTLINDTKGHLAVIGGQGKFKNSDLKVTLNINNVVSAMMPSFFKKEENIDLHCFATRWNIQDGKAITDSTLFETNKVSIAVAGVVDLVKLQMDLFVSPKAADRTLVDVAVPVRVKGDLTDPTILPGALPSLSMLGLVNLDLNRPADLLGVITPVDEMFNKQVNVPADVNKCVATIAYMKSKDKRKTRTSIQSLMDSMESIFK
ncbi:MAG: AsmA family protein [Proteobacteria bacterium]|nr:AsmA family protein [Pseudomonadota bacterium]